MENIHFQLIILAFLCEINPFFLDDLDFYRAITHFAGKI